MTCQFAAVDVSSGCSELELGVRMKNFLKKQKIRILKKISVQKTEMK